MAAPVRRFPSGGDYVEALQNPRLCFSDPELKTAAPHVDRLGRPKPISGNFASVFSLTTASAKRYAIKCFTREVPDQEKRYLAISEALRALPYDWKVGFDYQPRGVMVGGHWFPILKMEWVEAVGLTRWIDEHCWDQAALRGLADRFAELVADLDRSGIAHGDLQHGNLLVEADGRFKLVDYDGMYVPSLSGFPASEKGHRHYQSPLRTGAEFGPELDRFSAWLIHMSLASIAADPTLWHGLHEQDGEYLLLVDDDFIHPGTSARMANLRGHGTAEIRDFAMRISDLAVQPLTALPTLPPPATQPSEVRAPAARGLPAWMSGHVPFAPPRPVYSFKDHPGAMKGTRLTFLGLCAALGVVLWLTALPLMVRGAVPGAVLLVGLGVSRAVYATLPGPKARKAVVSRRTRAAQKTKRALRAVSGVESEGNKIQTDHARRMTANAKELHDLQGRHRLELGTFDRATAQQLSPLYQQIQALPARQAAELSGALDLLRQNHTLAYLKRVSLGPGDVQGVGAATVDGLRAAGIVTPADFVGIHSVAVGHEQTPEIHFLLPDGRSVHVQGVGETRASALENWRLLHVQAAMAQPSMPTTLPPATRQRIELGHQAEEKRLQEQRTLAEQARQSLRNDIVQRHAGEIRQITDGHNVATQATSRAMADTQRRLATARADHQTAEQEEQTIVRELQTHRHMSYPRFLRAVVFGR
ncbi:hypothetical protein [Spongiactinospora sp. TRM90649]|uniref:hypothetical protein n=1 Tax=Spongiactinospora sp. TRM90649 TaxID=3031114 RepID=UPI0023F850A6|nr:hypothetical protein [Spongiactinospora sp. TRM90649]MDF5752879.1 hypothetical protein [Spongiactinospora sp. TRM90649]